MAKKRRNEMQTWQYIHSTGAQSLPKKTFQIHVKEK